MTSPGGQGRGIFLGIPDPDTERRILEVIAAPGPVGGGGTFFVDPERAEECVRVLRGVALDLVATRQIMDLIVFPPPGADQVSVNMADQASVMADRAVRFVDIWRDQLAQTADALEQQLAAYRAAEQEQRNRLA